MHGMQERNPHTDAHTHTVTASKAQPERRSNPQLAPCLNFFALPSVHAVHRMNKFILRHSHSAAVLESVFTPVQVLGLVIGQSPVPHRDSQLSTTMVTLHPH